MSDYAVIHSRLEPTTNGFGFGGSHRLFLIPVISQCHKGFRWQSVPNDRVRIPVVSHS